ncbi:MAG: hypothetical protein IKQ94_09180 [Bacteroidales bacterium]|nr:hypothetical protein [Bacteroidales bacterium]
MKRRKIFGIFPKNDYICTLKNIKIDEKLENIRPKQGYGMALWTIVL